MQDDAFKISCHLRQSNVISFNIISSARPCQIFFCLFSYSSFMCLACYFLKTELEKLYVIQGGSSSKVVDCILCLKGYYEWKQAGGIGVWRYGGTVKITSFPNRSPSLVGSESTDESFDESESSQYEQLLEFLHLSNEVSLEESKTANALAFLFDRFGLRLLQAYLRESNGIEEFPLNAMVGKILSNLLCKYSYKYRKFI